MKNKYLFLSLSFFLTFPCLGKALTLEEAIRENSASSHELKQLRYEAEAQRWNETKARSGYWPRLELTGNHLFKERFQELELEFGGNNIVIPAIQPYTSLGVRANWEIFSGFQTLHRVAAARSAQASADHRLLRAEQVSAAHIRTLFFRALGSQVLVDVAQQNIQTLESHMRDVRARVRGGLSTRFDTLRFEVQLEEAKSDKLAAENNVVIQRAKLFEAIGIPDDGKPLEGALPTDFSRYDLAKVKFQIEAREDRAAQLANLQESEDLAKASHAHWYPRVSLFAAQDWYNNYNHSIWESDERFKSAYSLGVALRWDLFDGGESYSSQQQAALTQKINAEKLARLEQNAPVEIEESKRRLSYDITNYQAKISSVRKAEEAVRLAKGALSAGAITNTEVLDAVLDLNRAKAAAVKSQIDAVEALGDLEMALGSAI